MRYQIEPHELGPRLLGKFLFLTAWPTLLVAMRRRRPTEFWLGDSHAMSVNRSLTHANFMRGPEGQLILRAGPRLMYSLARDGFPPGILRVARLVERAGRRGSLVPVFCAGEIDVRAHLADRPDDGLDFVADYVRQCVALATRLKADRLGFAVPIPPIDVGDHEVWFPVVGSTGQRVEVHRRLRAELHQHVAAVPGAFVIDCTEVLAGPDGTMPIELTRDGAHTDAAARARIRAHVATLGLREPAPTSEPVLR